MKTAKVSTTSAKQGVSKALSRQPTKLRLTAGQSQVITSRSKPKTTVR